MTCLVVCDSIPMTKTIEEYAGELNCFRKLNSVLDANAAMQELNKFSYNLVLLVLSHPKEANLDMLTWIRGQGIDAEIVIISSNAKTDKIRRAFGYGVCDYLIKPMSLARFKQGVNRAVQRHAYLNDYKYLSQTEVDQYLSLSALKQAKTPEANKGIAKQTYKRIANAIGSQATPFTAGALAEKTKLSRITVRRYLESMVEKGVLTTDYVYGEIGRPQKVYKKANEE